MLLRNAMACPQNPVHEAGMITTMSGMRITVRGRLQHGPAGSQGLQRQLRPEHRRQRRAARLRIGGRLSKLIPKHRATVCSYCHSKTVSRARKAERRRYDCNSEWHACLRPDLCRSCGTPLPAVEQCWISKKEVRCSSRNCCLHNNQTCASEEMRISSAAMLA